MKTSKTMNILNILLMSSKPLIPMWWWDAWTNLLTGGGLTLCGRLPLRQVAVVSSSCRLARFGFEVARASPRQADFVMVAGTIVHRMAPVLKRLYDQLAEPKYVVAVGGCAVSGGPFKNSYHVLKGVDEILPVDVYIPGCPPRPEAMFYGLMQLQRKVKVEKFFGGVNRQEKREKVFGK